MHAKFQPSFSGVGGGRGGDRWTGRQTSNILDQIPIQNFKLPPCFAREGLLNHLGQKYVKGRDWLF